jgi:hypothetical protein
VAIEVKSPGRGVESDHLREAHGSDVGVGEDVEPVKVETI